MTTPTTTPTTTTRWVTWGDVRGQGPVRRTAARAARDLAADEQGCESQGGYSDRAVYAVDADGYLLTRHEDEPPNYVYQSQGCGAVRIDD